MNSFALVAVLLPAIVFGASDTLLIPPVLSHGALQPVPKSAGEEIALHDGDVKFTLFLPRHWADEKGSNFLATIHFHTVASSAIASHVQRGSPNPMLVFALGSGSAAYRKPFEDTNRFSRVLSIAQAKMRSRHPEARIDQVELSSFSAGYGAVRELLKTPAHVARIDRIVLLDSIYGGLMKSDGTNRVVDPEHVNVWAPFADAARRGEKTFMVTLSQVQPETFASTVECTSALLSKLGMQLTATSRTEPTNSFPLLARADAGNLHVWSYGGTNGAAHMAHVHHAAEVWRTIDVPRH